ncbi:phospholipid-transporting P-type ATPase [Blattamonas nauphoetae]|uniref:Phospholipid-transporting ATPase n=1 Tax=Blattamonas nauphoetae TaxID=2049346 RepID=A0ABQ9XCQ0_9EUKA|nr:phospholipid-transporting P-type ATPase [Blattamonas nauphoetae]
MQGHGDNRHITVGKGPQSHKFCSNRVQTTKFSWWSYLPLSLFNQLKKFSNLYFILNMGLNLIPGINIVSPTSSIIPVIFLIGIGLVTDLIEDLRRFYADKKVNNVPTQAYRDGSFQTIPTLELVVGDLVLIKSNEEIPADCVLLASTEERNVAYVNTMNLDGEGNLKTKHSHPFLSTILHGLPFDTNETTGAVSLKMDELRPQISTLKGDLHCLQPNREINQFAGRFEFHSKSEPASLSTAQLLLRGCFLKNTQYALALVVYTGKETKMQLNSRKSKGKFSRLNRRLNWSVLVMFMLLLFYMFLGAGLQVYLNNSQGSDHPYLATETMNGFDFAFQLLAGFVYFHNNLPTSLFVSIEIGRFIQMFFLQWDHQMRDESRGSDGKMIARTSNLNEELGMIRHIFSDKTGTLTANKMDFKRASLGHSVFNTDLDKPPRPRVNSTVSVKSEPREIFNGMSNTCEHQAFKDLAHLYLDECVPTYLSNPSSTGNNSVSPNLPPAPGLPSPSLDLPPPPTGLPPPPIGLPSPMSDLPPPPDDLPPPPADFSPPIQLSAPPTYLNRLDSKYNAFHFINALLLCHEAVIESQLDLKLLRGEITAPPPPIGNMSVNAIPENKSSVELSNLHVDANGDKVFEKIYQSTSPDEIALLSVIAKRDICYLSRTVDTIEVNLKNRTHTFPLVALLPFTSERRRMSVIVRLADGTNRLYMKGADSSIIPLCTVAEQEKAGDVMESQGIVEQFHNILASIDDFSRDGLRTLAVATRLIPEKELDIFKQKLKTAQEQLVGREEATAKCFDELEHNMELVGCTGVEDELQEDCPQTISFLKECGMNIWILTGDKVATAVNVGFTCGLISRDTIPVYITDDSLKEFNETRVKMGKESLYTEHVKVGSDTDNLKLPSRLPCKKAHEDAGLTEPIQILLDDLLSEKIKREETSRDNNNDGGNIAIIADGYALNVIVSSAVLVDKFLKLAELGVGVVCCRIAPMQKALIVRMVRSRRRDIISLAIGDGANDVSMIREAHVGIGIKGVEGTSASQVSDYSIAKFKYLKRLLVVHGHYNFYRLSTMIKYSYYKNLSFCTQFVFYLVYTLCSFQVPYDSHFISFFNLLYTSIPIIVTMLLDKDIPEWLLERQPKIYKQYRNGKSFTIRTFIKWLLLGWAVATFLFFSGMVFHNYGEVSKNGTVEGLLFYGVMTGTAAFTGVSFVYLWKTQYWTILIFIGFILSILIYGVGSILVTVVTSLGKDFYHEFFHAFASPVFYLYILFTTLTVAVLFTIVYYFEREFCGDVKVRAINTYIKGARWPHKPIKQS